MQVQANKISNIRWKVGVALASKKAVRLDRPYVSLMFDITNGSKVIETHSMEMSIQQFRVCFSISLFLFFHGQHLLLSDRISSQRLKKLPQKWIPVEDDYFPKKKILD